MSKIDNFTVAYDDVPSIRFAVQHLCNAIKYKGGSAHTIAVQEGNFEQAKHIQKTDMIVVTTCKSPLFKTDAPEQIRQSISIIEEQSYSIRVYEEENRTIWWVVGADPVGAMYGGLDFADEILLPKKLSTIGERDHQPHIEQRGIKFNIPLDARTPSYSDHSDSAQANIAEMWSYDFWRTFLDEMALQRYNVLSLWNLHPFPSLVKVPEYPDIALDDVKKTTVPIYATTKGINMSDSATLANLVTIKKMTIEDKIAFWRKVMQYAKDRGISFYVITWNIFVYGTEGNRYGITVDQNNETTIDYFRASVRALFETYPLLAGIGVTSGENMHQRGATMSDGEWLWRAYGAAINDVKKKDPNRRIRFIQRTHWASISDAINDFSGLNEQLEFSYKYSMAHMYSSANPPFIENDQLFDHMPRMSKTWLTVRNDDFYYFRWGDPAFARQYVLNMPSKDRLAGYLYGSDGYTWGREFVSKESSSPRQLVIQKMGYSFSIWGKLTYNPLLSDEVFRNSLAVRFPEIPGNILFEAWSHASRIIPLVTTFHWKGNHFDFQWYPEACYSHPDRAKGFHTVRHFIQDEPMPKSGMMSIPAYCDALRNKRALEGVTPLQIAFDLQYFADKTLLLLQHMPTIEDEELRATLMDLEAMATLGHYYAEKIRAAVQLCMYELGGEREQQQAAIAHLERASSIWNRYASIVSKQYVPQLLARLGYDRIDVQRLQTEVDRDIEIAQLASPAIS